jgi:hypothetical protein
MKRSASLIILPVLFSAAPLCAKVAVRIEPRPGASPTAGGFLPARLILADPDGELPGVVGAVTLRRGGGGPTLLFSASVPPRTEQAIAVALPAVSGQQSYTVRLLAAPDAPSPLLGTLSADVRWPDLDAVEQCRSTLIDSAAYSDWVEELPRWPPRLLRTVFLTAVLVCVALAGALFLRGPALRLGAALLVAAAGTLVLWRAVSDCEVVLARRGGDLTAVTCRRTTTWSHGAEGFTPVYWNRKQMDEDAMLYQPGRRLRLTLTPEEVRVFRRHPRQPATTQAGTQSSAGL